MYYYRLQNKLGFQNKQKIKTVRIPLASGCHSYYKSYKIYVIIVVTIPTPLMEDLMEN
jgi:hypothetical protein